MSRCPLFLAVLAALAAWISPAMRADETAPKADPAETPASPWADFVEPNFPFFSSVLDARNLNEGWPTNNLTPRGLILNLGHGAWACFDTELLRVSALWTGHGVTPVSMSQGSYHVAGAKAPEGQKKLPEPDGTLWLASGLYPGWQTGTEISLDDPREPGPDIAEVGRGPLPPTYGQLKAVRLTAEGALLEYTAGGAAVQETMRSRLEKNHIVVERRFHLEGVEKPLWLVLGQRPESLGPLRMAVSQTSGSRIQQHLSPGRLMALRIVPSRKPVDFTVAISLDAAPKLSQSSQKIKPSLPAPLRWPETAITQGRLSADTNAFVVDAVPVPRDNPWRRNVRLADIGYFADGRAAAVSFDGDVWMISGLDNTLRDVRWRRFTSGLHEPMGLCVRGGELFVNDRNGIWRLRDTDGNGEADVHELFSNAFGQTAETREFATGLRAGPDGSFYIGKGGQQSVRLGKHNGSVLRVLPDGKSAEVMGWGLRQPFLGVHPETGLVTASDQQGHYVPATPLHIVRGRQYYGFIPNALPKEQYPAPIADPLTWIPHTVNASGAGQVWLAGAQMGPLNGAMIHIGYNRPELFLVLMNRRASREQAAVVSLTRDLDFGPIFGAVNPRDGQLWVTGFKIWGTTAKELSGLARLRHTGQPSLLPKEIVPMNQGVLLAFDVALDEASATHPANFSAERWSYKRSANYGSPHFKSDDTKGQDLLRVTSAYLSRDGKSVFVGIPDMQPTMQMRLGWSLKTQGGGTELAQNAYFTVSELAAFNPGSEGFEPVTVDLVGQAASDMLAETPVSAEEGRRLAEMMGCMACHSTDGSTLGKEGPTWKNLFGMQRVFADGTRAVADEAYLRQSILDPAAKVVKGFENSEAGMPSYEGVISNAQLESLILFLKALNN